MPAHHKLETFLDEYIRTAEIAGDEKSPLFCSAVRRTGTLGGEGDAPGRRLAHGPAPRGPSSA
jgi:hypothetical protein